MTKRIEKGPFKGMTVVAASQEQVEVYAAEVDEVLRAIAKLMLEPDGDLEDWIGHCFVTDGSEVGDFFRDDAQCDALGIMLGIPVTRHTRIWQAAEAIRRGRVIQ